MENNNEQVKKGHFDAFVHAVGSEIEQAQVRLITAANAQDVVPLLENGELYTVPPTPTWVGW